jgi:hypothetical protein
MSMIRPWMGVLGAAAVLAALPAAASAQTTADTTPPTVTIVSPAEGATYVQGQPVAVAFSCTDDTQVADCVGSTANGGSLDTAAIGPGTFTVTAHDTAGNPKVEVRHYSVVVQDPGDVGGETPATLTLALGPAAPFAPFIPGAAKDYTTTMTARVLSTAADATLTVADPSPTGTGRLVNGTYVMAQGLLVAAASANGHAFPAAPIGGSASPTTLLSWNGPANDDVALTFTQPIGATDTLRTGSYSKTLTFTLSTTNP